MWTSYDYLSEYLEQEDIVVGGVVNFQLYYYPELCRSSQSKFFILTFRMGYEKYAEY